MEFFIIFFIWLILGSTTAYLASRKGRDPLVWSLAIMLVGVAGLLFSLIGLLILLALPPIGGKEEEVIEVLQDEHASPAASFIVHQEWMKQPWFYFNAKKERIGPVSFEELQGALKTKELQLESFVWTENMAGWKKVSEVEGLEVQLKKEIAPSGGMIIAE